MVLKLARIVGLPVEQPLVVNILFADDARMARLNHGFLGHCGTTDVITFSYLDEAAMPEPGSVAVDLAIGAEVAERMGKAIPGSSRARELTLYLAHGLLHAAGEDDLTAAARRKMRQRERKAMALLEQYFDFAEVFPEDNGC